MPRVTINSSVTFDYLTSKQEFNPINKRLKLVKSAKMALDFGAGCVGGITINNLPNKHQKCLHISTAYS